MKFCIVCSIVLAAAPLGHSTPASERITKAAKQLSSDRGTVFITMYFRGDDLLLDRLESARDGRSTDIYEQFYLHDKVVYTRMWTSGGSESQTIRGNADVDVILKSYAGDIYPKLLSIQTKGGTQELFELVASRFEPLEKSDYLKRSSLVMTSFLTEDSEEARQEMQQRKMRTEQGAAANP